MRPLVRIVLLTLLLLTTSVLVAQDDDLRFIDFEIEPDFTAQVELTWEADDISVLFDVRTADDSGVIYLIGIYTADDEVIYEFDNPDSLIEFGFPPEAEPFSGDIGGELGVFIPVSPAFDFEPGDYLFAFESEESPIQEISAIVRSGDADTAQAIDFNFWVLAEDMLDTTVQNAFADDFRSRVDELLNPAGLEVGEIAFFEASDNIYDQFAYPVIDEESERALQELCAAMSEEVGATRALNVAILEGFDEGDDGDTVGYAISAGNTGIIMRPSAFSCVVVSYEAYGDDFANQAMNIFHEGGHFMSLSHTSETEGDEFDIFDDTPECSAEVFDEDGDGSVTDIECGEEGGANNVMFWGIEGEDPEEYVMSDSQFWVLRRHPLFYPVGR